MGEMNTMEAPYVMKMNAPSILPMVFDDPRRHTFEATVEHQEGQMLHIITNAPEMSNFKVTPMESREFLNLMVNNLLLLTTPRLTRNSSKFFYSPMVSMSPSPLTGPHGMPSRTR